MMGVSYCRCLDRKYAEIDSCDPDCLVFAKEGYEHLEMSVDVGNARPYLMEQWVMSWNEERPKAVEEFLRMDRLVFTAEECAEIRQYLMHHRRHRKATPCVRKLVTDLIELLAVCNNGMEII